MNEFYLEARSRLAKTEIKKLTRNAFIGLLLVVSNGLTLNWIESQNQAQNERISVMDARQKEDEYLLCRTVLANRPTTEEEDHLDCVSWVLERSR